MDNAIDKCAKASYSLNVPRVEIILHAALRWLSSNIVDLRLFPGAYTTHQLVCRMALTSYDQIPENLAEYCYVEFTMPATQVSHTTARSVSLQNSDSDAPPEKYVRNLSRHEYR